MASYTVSFITYHNVIVEAENVDKAFDLAEREVSDYDEVEIWENDGDEEAIRYE